MSLRGSRGDGDRRDRPLCDAIANALERNGGRIEVPYVAVLLLTVRKD